LAAIGLSIIAANANITVLSKFAFLTSIMLVFAHTVSKTLLFMSAGHAKRATHEDSIDNVRGIWHSIGKIPAIAMTVSSMSFSAFPPLIGFVSEWMILEAMFQSYKFSSILDRVSAAFSGILIALAMGLASFSMVKLVGYTALGYDHKKKVDKINSKFMNLSELLLTLVVILSGLFAPFLIKFIGYGEFLSGLLGVVKPFLIVSSKPIFGVVSPTFLTIVAGLLFIFPLIFYLYRKPKVRKVNAFNGGEVLKEDEYYTVGAYSFTLEFILRKIYSTKGIKKGNERFVLVKDNTNIMYSKLVKSIYAISKAVSRVLMNGRIPYYILYTVIIFVLIFFIAK
jgi:hydrogenase-4 component B